MAGTLVVGCSSIGLGGNGNSPAVNTNGGVRLGTLVTAGKVTQGAITQTVSYSGTVQPADTVNVVPKTAGRITKLNVDVGSQVKAGEVIAQLDQTSLQAQLEQAQAGLEAARVKLEQIQAGARPEAIAAAEANARGAAAKLTALQNGARPEAVGQAQANLNAAEAKLALVEAGARPESVGQAKANLDLAKAKLAQLKDGPSSDQIAASQLAVSQAQNSLFAAQANRDGVCGNKKNPAYLCNQAQAQVDAAQTAVNTAQQNLKILSDPPGTDSIAQAQASVDAAQQAYDLSQKPYTAQDIAQAQAAVAAAQEAYNLAAAPYTAQDIAQAQASADAASDQAKLAASPYTDLDVKAAQAAVDQAQAAVDLAQSNLADATVLAPFDGVISAKLLSVGALASTTSPIATLLSPRLQVEFSVEEARIANIKVGETIDLTTSAFPDKVFPAQVTSIFPSADPKTHTFTVVVETQNNDQSLKAGMFTSLKVILASKTNAILAPRAAVIQQGNQEVMFVDADGKAQLHPVTLGLTDDANVEVLSGVKVGDQVITAGQGGLHDGDPVRLAGAAGSGQRGGAPGQSQNGGRTGQSGSSQNGSGQGRPQATRTSGAAATPTP